MKILLVEDTVKLANLVAENLGMGGYVVEIASTAEEALDLTHADVYDAIILDRMLPDNKDGLGVCADLRARGDHTPILMLTALGNIDARVEGFENGTDDYLSKPFDMRELLARVSALTRRPKETSVPVLVKAAGIHINLAKKRVEVRGEEIKLSRGLWRLLEYLAVHQGQTIGKDVLIDRVWGMDSDVLENAVEAAIRNLRRKLGDDKGETIQTVHGFGYRLKS